VTYVVIDANGAISWKETKEFFKSVHQKNKNASLA
jgi:hypothetical protein